MKRVRLIIATVLALGTLTVIGGCGKKNEVKHSDYGFCERTGKHRHNDHIFIGDFHDHSLCEWEKFN
jgi:hypothetical protein